ncbi:hypothetical protein ELI_2263 [Eubacterium callanderi]|uniref:Uncharacterized protein n=1 Tax=Eubacterium callanderi TaxID=53442 RepID=E3GMX4_9FIRM|nr:hypothetical protein ELI_2263 [Eubacterium callanderi]
MQSTWFYRLYLFKGNETFSVFLEYAGGLFFDVELIFWENGSK